MNNMQKVTDKQLLDVIECHEGQNLTVRTLASLVGLKSTQTMHKRLKRLEQAEVIAIKTGTFITVKDKQLPQYPGDNNAEQHIERLEHLLARTCGYLRKSDLPYAGHLLQDIEQAILEPPKGGE